VATRQINSSPIASSRVWAATDTAGKRFTPARILDCQNAGLLLRVADTCSWKAAKHLEFVNSIVRIIRYVSSVFFAS
jgi:hypothetical protein